MLMTLRQIKSGETHSVCLVNRTTSLHSVQHKNYCEVTKANFFEQSTQGQKCTKQTRLQVKVYKNKGSQERSREAPESTPSEKASNSTLAGRRTITSIIAGMSKLTTLELPLQAAACRGRSFR
jgi:hypothetical protein